MTQDTTHTAGPWTVDRWKDDKSQSRGISIKGGGQYLANMVFQIKDENELANAALIAAAPSMLEALIEVVSNCTAQEGDDMAYEALQQAIRAIAKAKGGA